MTFLVGEGISVHDTYVVNTDHTYLPDVADQQISLLLWYLFNRGRIVMKGPCRLVLSLTHFMTSMDEMIVVHKWGG